MIGGGTGSSLVTSFASIVANTSFAAALVSFGKIGITESSSNALDNAEI